MALPYAPIEFTSNVVACCFKCDEFPVCCTMGQIKVVVHENHLSQSNVMICAQN